MKQHNYKTGDIIHHSWGYDQTNADFYQVVRTSEKSIWIAAIHSSEKIGSSLYGKAEPIPNAFVIRDSPGIRKVPYQLKSEHDYFTGRWFVKINSYTAGAEQWNGEQISVTHYA